MNRILLRIVALILVPCLVVDPIRVMASIGPVGAGHCPRPQSEFHPIQSIQISGRHGGLPLQFSFTSQALALPTTADPHGCPLAAVAKQVKPLVVSEALSAAPAAADSVLAGHYVDKLIVQDMRTGHMTALRYVTADQLDPDARLAAIGSLERWPRPTYEGTRRDLLSALRTVSSNRSSAVQAYHEESLRAFHLAIAPDGTVQGYCAWHADENFLNLLEIEEQNRLHVRYKGVGTELLIAALYHKQTDASIKDGNDLKLPSSYERIVQILQKLLGRPLRMEAGRGYEESKDVFLNLEEMKVIVQKQSAKVDHLIATNGWQQAPDHLQGSAGQASAPSSGGAAPARSLPRGIERLFEAPPFVAFIINSLGTLRPKQANAGLLGIGTIPLKLNRQGQRFFEELHERPVDADATLLWMDTHEADEAKKSRPFAIILQHRESKEVWIFNLPAIDGYEILAADAALHVAKELCGKTPYSSGIFNLKLRQVTTPASQDHFNMLTITRGLHDEILSLFGPDSPNSLDYQEVLSGNHEFFSGHDLGIIGPGSGVDILYALRYGAPSVEAYDEKMAYVFLSRWNHVFAEETGQVPVLPAGAVRIMEDDGFRAMSRHSRYVFNSPLVRKSRRVSLWDPVPDWPLVKHAFYIALPKYQAIMEDLKRRLMDLPGAQAIVRVLPGSDCELAELSPEQQESLTKIPSDHERTQVRAQMVAENYLSRMGFTFRCLSGIRDYPDPDNPGRTIRLFAGFYLLSVDSSRPASLPAVPAKNPPNPRVLGAA